MNVDLRLGLLQPTLQLRGSEFIDQIGIECLLDTLHAFWGFGIQFNILKVFNFQSISYLKCGRPASSDLVQSGRKFVWLS